VAARTERSLVESHLKYAATLRLISSPQLYLLRLSVLSADQANTPSSPTDIRSSELQVPMHVFIPVNQLIALKSALSPYFSSVWDMLIAHMWRAIIPHEKHVRILLHHTLHHVQVHGRHSMH